MQPISSKHLLSAAILTSFLSACGGGGGADGTTPTSSGPTEPPPTIKQSKPNSLALNDTGIELSAPATLQADCTAAITTGTGATTVNIPQDCDQGRDALARAGELTKTGSGQAGFDFTKLGSDGQPLADQAATEWSCTKDNVTGLIWENKAAHDTGMGNVSLHDRGSLFVWQLSGVTSTSATRAATQCFGYNAADPNTYCTTSAFVERVNKAALCGLTNWRLPNVTELVSIFNYNPVAAGTYFARPLSTKMADTANHWTGVINGTNPTQAWTVSAGGGATSSNQAQSSAQALLLVSGGQ